MLTLFAQAADVAQKVVEKAAEKAPDAAAKAAEVASQAAPAVADAAAAATGPQWWEYGALGLMINGGPFMWPILLMGIVAFGVMIERYRSLKMLSTNTEALRMEILGLLRADHVEKALAVCEREHGPVPAILGAGLRKFLVLKRLNYDVGKLEEQVVKAMDDYGVHVVAALERHLPILATISSVAPMIGFLGTVQGMIVSFGTIREELGTKNIVESAAAGIEVALLTTCFGLMVGIPTFMAFNYFTGVINRYVLDVEESATELIEAVTLQMAINQASEPAPPHSAPAHSNT